MMGPLAKTAVVVAAGFGAGLVALPIAGFVAEAAGVQAGVAAGIAVVAGAPIVATWAVTGSLGRALLVGAAAVGVSKLPLGTLGSMAVYTGVTYLVVR